MRKFFVIVLCLVCLVYAASEEDYSETRSASESEIGTTAAWEFAGSRMGWCGAAAVIGAIVTFSLRLYFTGSFFAVSAVLCFAVAAHFRARQPFAG